MFYMNPNCAFKILGVFYVERSGANDLQSTMRKHTAIAYRLKGTSQFHCGAGTQTAVAASVTYIPAYADYTRSSTSEILIVIHLQGFGELGDNIEIINNAAELEPLFQKLLAAWENGNTGAYNRCMKLLYSIFDELQGINAKQESPIPAIIKPGVELLQARYADPSLRIADLADVCYISEVHFRNIFHRHFEASPQQALAALRFHRVCEMLCSGYYTQKEAARLAGFADVKYFRTAFKKHTGMTPSAYIKQHAGVFTAD